MTTARRPASADAASFCASVRTLRWRLVRRQEVLERGVVWLPVVTEEPSHFDLDHPLDWVTNPEIAPLLRVRVLKPLPDGGVPLRVATRISRIANSTARSSPCGP